VPVVLCHGEGDLLVVLFKGFHHLYSSTVASIPKSSRRHFTTSCTIPTSEHPHAAPFQECHTGIPLSFPVALMP
jgi:hypothetical protein